MTNHDDTPSEPPPSYSDAMKDPPVEGSAGPIQPLNQHIQYARPPPQIHSGSSTRPSAPLPYSNQNGVAALASPGKSSTSYTGSGTSYTGSGTSYTGSGTSHSAPGTSYSAPGNSAGPSANLATRPDALYTNNSGLPFVYPRGHFCRKCKNTGFKDSRGKPCGDCWKLLFRDRAVYNPNRNLPFQYPSRYLCEKCLNTGTKWKSGRLCLDCYERFAPRNNYSVVQSGPFCSGPMGSFGFPSSFSGFGSQQIGPAPGMLVPPGDPRLGGVLCGRCRGSGLVTFILDQELCPVCSGLGRIVNVPGGYC